MQQQAKKRSLVRELFNVLVPALLVAVLVQSFVFKPFRIPSESMMPTLLVGDYIYVPKYSYGYSRFSFPYALVPFSGRIFAAEPKRGDVLVFRLPTNTSADYIKRVVGLPGDEVQMRGGVLHINGVAVPRRQVEDFVMTEEGMEGRAPQYVETLANGVTYSTLDLAPNGPLDTTQVYRVPAGHFFMLGDNRDDSTDSRVLDEVGYVPFENIIGRADFVFFSVGHGAPAWQFWRWPWTLRFGRMFGAIR